MKRISIIFLALFCFTLNAQSIKKGFKYLNNGKFENAEVELNEVQKIDSLNPELWLGYALLYSNEGYSNFDFFLALNYVQKSKDLFNMLDTKSKKKFKHSYSIDSVMEQITIIDQKLYNYLKNKDDIDLYNRYINEYNKGNYVYQIKKLRNSNEFKTAQNFNTVDAYNYFIKTYPDAVEVKQAVEKRNEMAYKITEEQNSIEAYNNFINTYPDAIDIKKAILKRNSLDFELTKKENSINAYEKFLHNYPNTPEFCIAFHIRNEMVFMDEVQKQNKESFSKLLIRLKEFENDTLKVEKSIIDRVQKLQELIYAKEYYIFYISNQNLYRINNADLKIEQLTTDGNIIHFATNINNDIVFLVLKPDVAEFYKFESNNERTKICELKKVYVKDFFIFNSLNSGFHISNDLNQILLNFGDFDPGGVGYTHEGLWEKSTNKWKICRVFDDGCDINIDKICFDRYEEKEVKYNNSDEYFVKRNFQVFDLYRRNKSNNSEINLSNIQDIFQEENSEHYGTFFINENKNKIFFYFIEVCGDFCYGPLYIVNNDGTFQKQITRTSSMGYNPYSWIEGSGDLIVHADDKLILYAGKENIPQIIAENIIEFKKVHLSNCNYSFDIESFQKIYNEKMTYYLSIK